jgi:hypothetical protein
MRIEIRDTYAIDNDEYWDEVFFDDAYNAALYGPGMGFDGREIIEQTTGEDGRVVRRRMRVDPKLDAPAPVKKALGGSTAYTEEGQMSADRRWKYRIIPARMADRIRIEGEMWGEPAGEGRMVRVARIDVDVRIFGLGKVIEKFVEKSMRDAYRDATRFTNEWLRKRAAAS